MLYIENAWNQRGWDSRDHLLDDSDLEEMIGKTYPNLSSLKKIAQKLANSFPTIIYRDQFGKRWKYDGSPNIPGRNRCVVGEVKE